MDDAQISAMVSAIVEEVDYDIWKDLYLGGMEDQVKYLEEIAKRHIWNSMNA